MNINTVKCTPTMFKDFKSQYALCEDNGSIVQTFTQLQSAKYMLTEYNLGATIHEVVVDNKGNIVSDLGEV